MKLTAQDYAALERCYIPPGLADHAGIYRVNSIDGRALVGRNGGGDYAGIVFPYPWPGESHPRLHRLRLDHPPVGADGKPEHKYLMPPGARNLLYLPPGTEALLGDPRIPVVIVEGEKKCLAMWRAARELGNGTGRPAFLPIAIAGVYSFRGVIGARTTASGERVPEKGLLPDFWRLDWSGGRRSTILFDVNAATNPIVQSARRELAREMTRHLGAEVWIANLPAAPNVNGPDDYLALFGLTALAEVLSKAVRYEWRAELITNKGGKKVLSILANAVTALTSAPEWWGVLGWDKFSTRVIATKETPWEDRPENWTDQQDRRATEWLQHHGILVSIEVAGQAVQTVAQENPVHPVRSYLEGLRWDEVPRIDHLLRFYCGAEPSDLTRAMGARWLISAVARVFEPGCQADCVLVLEGAQGIAYITWFYPNTGESMQSA
jgi:hypothetical protein